MSNKPHKTISLKVYHTIRFLCVIAVAITVSQSVLSGYFIVPVAVIALTSWLLLYLRKRVDGVVADERDYDTGGHAARWAIQVYSWIAVVGMIALFALRTYNPYFEIAAYTLAYSTCILVILYSLIFRIRSSSSSLISKKHIWYIILLIILLVGFTLATARLISGEDSWICENGQWIEHGHPSTPAPIVPCTD